MLNLQLTWPSLSFITMSTGVSCPCMALYSDLMLMPCFDVPKASVHGYPMVRGGRFLASCGGWRREKKEKKQKKKKQEMRHRKATATNAQLHLRWPFNTMWCLKKSNRAPNTAVSREREVQHSLREPAALLLTDGRINSGCGARGDKADKAAGGAEQFMLHVNGQITQTPTKTWN